MLLRLEEEGEEVYYSAPLFHRVDELNDAFLSQQVRNRSKWIRPFDIGVLAELADDSAHHLSFDIHGGSMTVFSEPRAVEVKREFSDVVRVSLGSVVPDVVRGFREQLRTRGDFALQDKHLEKLIDVVRVSLGSVERPIYSRGTVESFAEERLDKATALSRAAYYSAVFLSSQLFVVQGK